MICMRIDSCTKCGTELQVKKNCKICNKANQFYCHHCGNITEEQVHFQCMMVSFDITLLDLKQNASTV